MSRPRRPTAKSNHAFPVRGRLVPADLRRTEYDMNLELNELASQLIEDVTENPQDFRVIATELSGSGLLLDFGVEAEGGLEAGAMLASVCMAGLADVSLTPGSLGDLHWPQVAVQTDYPVASCLFSQYAGWQISVGKYFAMGSGPMRAAVATEP
ncbi:MAG: hypothetical protein B7Z55_15195, partial [Planctomycetales bacterium 12-60-4]